MDYLSSISLIIYIHHLLIKISNGQVIFSCNYTANFTTNSTYAINRQTLLFSFPSQVTSGNATAGDFFYSSSVGQGSDKVFGHAICQADYTAQHCRESINDIFLDLMRTKCPNQKEAIAVGSHGIHYSNRPINGILELEPTRVSPLSTKSLDSSDNTVQFYQIWYSLMEDVIERASMKPVVKFATGEANYSSSGDRNIYVLMQCFPDLSPSDCRYCLNQTVSYFESNLKGKAGGYVEKPSCWFRWELYRFYEIKSDVAPLTPVTGLKSAAKGGITSLSIGFIVVAGVSFLFVVTLLYVLYRRKKTSNFQHINDVYKGTNGMSSVESLQFDIQTLRIATNGFSIENKLGEGGFGTVYKGRLPNGESIAVKRWSENSTQGENEFENEVILLAQLQHRNLVRLLGYCIQHCERLLVYEFVPNQSLDSYIFDSQRRLLLDWKKRYKIIEGITRGILYLHQDSQLQIIHRDLKPSNILLDQDMNPKISDFGTAKLFAVDESQISTRRIVGTYGYMPPEYAIYGQVSTKSDVFSFGVLVLEIMSGQKVSHFGNAQSNDNNLLSYAWRNWKEGRPLNLIDKSLLSSGSRQEMIRCIHIGLLCVQEDLGRRPTMASIVLMLSSHSVSLPVPSRPAYLMTAMDFGADPSSLDHQLRIMNHQSVNELSVSYLSPR